MVREHSQRKLWQLFTGRVRGRRVFLGRGTPVPAMPRRPFHGRGVPPAHCMQAVRCFALRGRILPCRGSLHLKRSGLRPVQRSKKQRRKCQRTDNVSTEQWLHRDVVFYSFEMPARALCWCGTHRRQRPRLLRVPCRELPAEQKLCRQHVHSLRSWHILGIRLGAMHTAHSV